jgi:hypothetical protein
VWSWLAPIAELRAKNTTATAMREAFYWLAVLFTFALGTAAGDLDERREQCDREDGGGRAKPHAETVDQVAFASRPVNEGVSDARR